MSKTEDVRSCADRTLHATPERHGCKMPFVILGGIGHFTTDRWRMEDMIAGTGHSTNTCSSMAATHCYRKTPLAQLAYDISRRGDSEALRELHEHRAVFGDSTGHPVLMAGFLVGLKDRDITFRWCGQDSVVVDQAYDLTLAKFFNLPSNVCATQTADSPDGPNCRYYYGAFYDYVTKKFRKQPPTGTVEAEIRAAEALRQMTVRHFYLSCLECRRRALKLVKRYCWTVNGNHLTIWLPVEMSASRCRVWLQDNVSDCDFSRPGERDRVQAIVDRRLARRRIFSLDDLQKTEVDTHITSAGKPLTYAEEISVIGLASAVAREKAENIDEQRPAIRRLGRARLKELIQAVFNALTQDGYCAERIATEFHLSNASYSRFAGCRWTRDMLSAVSIPDLWRNLAQVLAHHDDFVSLARQAGVWDRVRGIIDGMEGQKGESE